MRIDVVRKTIYFVPWKSVFSTENENIYFEKQHENWENIRKWLLQKCFKKSFKIIVPLMKRMCKNLAKIWNFQNFLWIQWQDFFFVNQIYFPLKKENLNCPIPNLYNYVDSIAINTDFFSFHFYFSKLLINFIKFFRIMGLNFGPMLFYTTNELYWHLNISTEPRSFKFLGFMIYQGKKPTSCFNDGWVSNSQYSA